MNYAKTNSTILSTTTKEQNICLKTLISLCKSYSKEREKNSLQLTQPFGFSRQLMRQLCTKHGAAAPRDRSMELLRIDVPLQRQQQSNRRLWLDSPLGSLLQTRAESTRLTSLASQFFNLRWSLELRKTEMGWYYSEIYFSCYNHDYALFFNSFQIVCLLLSVFK